MPKTHVLEWLHHWCFSLPLPLPTVIYCWLLGASSCSNSLRNCVWDGTRPRLSGRTGEGAGCTVRSQHPGASSLSTGLVAPEPDPFTACGWERGAFLSSTDVPASALSFDLKTLPVDFVECLMRFLPTENEVKVLRLYERERKPLESLSDEDRFMMQFSKIERLLQKMTIMAFIGNFAESIQMLTPVSDQLGPGREGPRETPNPFCGLKSLSGLCFVSWALKTPSRNFLDPLFSAAIFFALCMPSEFESGDVFRIAILPRGWMCPLDFNVPVTAEDKEKPFS